MHILTLEDAGWRKLCPKDAPVAPNLVAFCKWAGYNIIESEKDFLIEPRQFKSLYFLHASYHKGNFVPSAAEFDLGRLPPIPKLGTGVSVQDPERFIAQFLEGPSDSLQALRPLRGLVTLSDYPNFSKLMAHQVIPAFLEKYGEGRIHIIAISELLSQLHAQVRVLAPFEIFEATEIKPLGPFVGRMMAEAHATLAEDFGANALETVLHFMFPNCYGFLCPRLNCEVVFQLPTPVESLGRFPREILDFARWGSVFDQKTPGPELQNYVEGKTHDRASLLSRWVCPTNFAPNEITALLEWTIKRIDFLYRHLFDIAAHVDPETGYSSALLQKKRLMTIERLLIEANIIVSERDSYIRKTLFFNLHDKFASLMTKAGDLNARQKVFNRLLKRSHYLKRLRTIFQSIPPPFLEFVTNTGDGLYKDIFEGVMSDVWLDSRKQKKSVLASLDYSLNLVAKKERML